MRGRSGRQPPVAFKREHAPSAYSDAFFPTRSSATGLTNAAAAKRDGERASEARRASASGRRRSAPSSALTSTVTNARVSPAMREVARLCRASRPSILASRTKRGASGERGARGRAGGRRRRRSSALGAVAVKWLRGCSEREVRCSSRAPRTRAAGSRARKSHAVLHAPSLRSRARPAAPCVEAGRWRENWRTHMRRAHDTPLRSARPRTSS